MRSVFADSFLKNYSRRMVTTGWVLMELGDGLAQPVNRPAFLEMLSKA